MTSVGRSCSIKKKFKFIFTTLFGVNVVYDIREILTHPHYGFLGFREVSSPQLLSAIVSYHVLSLEQ